MSRILKAANVFIDQDNKVHIKVEELPLPEQAEAQLPEEAAENIIKKAEDEAAYLIRRAEMEAAALLEKARAEAASYKADVKARVEEEAQRIREQSHQEAYQKGMDEAISEGNAIKTEAQSIRDAAIKERDETRLAIEPDAVNLIINIIDKLLGNAIRVNPAVVVSLIRKGFAGSTLSGQITIRVSDIEFEHVLARKDELMAAAGGTAELEIVKDLSLSPTDCIIDTPFGGIDVSLTPQFEALRENLIFLLEHP